MTPKYDLKEIQSLVKSRDMDKIWFSAPSRSINEVIRVYKDAESPKNYEDAVDFIFDALLVLTGNDFVTVALQWENEFADIYGVIFDKLPWFVKFIFKDGELEEISFHPPKQEMKTVSGKIIPSEEIKNEEA